MTKIHFLNGAYITEDKAVLPITDLSILRGYAVFDYFRIVDGVALFNDLHLERFCRSAAYLDLEIPYSKKEMEVFIRELIKRNKIDRGAMRLMATGGSSEDGYSLGVPNIIFQAMNYPTFPPHFLTDGVKVMLDEYTRENPLVKSTNYIHGLQIKKKLEETGNDLVLYHHNGIISESDRSNFFIITQDGELCTAREDVLHGITRHNIIEMMTGVMQVSIRPITLTELANAKEAFFSSSAKSIMAVVSINGKPIGDGKPGQLTQTIFDAYDTYTKNYIAAQKKKFPAM